MRVKDFSQPKEVMLTPGTGMVDFPAVMARLIKGGFTKGPLIVECLTRGTLPEIAAEAKKTRVFLEDLVAKLPQGSGV
jgi:sugar phosphate isomerase/epimerase